MRTIGKEKAGSAPAYLVLEDGTVWPGTAHGAARTTLGEVVFNTSMTGYQEIITDPSYRGQFVLMTYPHIGNVGVNPEDEESARPWLSGLIVREMNERPSSWRSAESLPDYLARHDVPAITGVDTRALTLHIRERGSLKAALSTLPGVSPADLWQQARRWPGLDGRDLVREVTHAAPFTWQEGAGSWQPLADSAGPLRPIPDGRVRIAVLDFGVKRNILRRLAAHGAVLTIFPADTPAGQLLAMHPDGVFLSNGPGDPAGVPYAVATVEQLLASGLPMFGICLGHQIMALALGGRTHKMKFGHHGGNQPVLDLAGGRVQITAQNHSYVVDPAALLPEVEITHSNLNDGSVEGMRLRNRPVFSVQYHPEASPGPHDADYLFAEFIRAIREKKA